MAAVVYVTRNGLLEPLGQSQVMAYLRGLSREYDITLITYEKQADWDDTNARSQAYAECGLLGIRWRPQPFVSRPRAIAPLVGFLGMTWLLWREVRRQDARIIHARSYIPAAAALAVSLLRGVPFIFDMRALWPEELITAGRLRRGSLIHAVIVAAEHACLARAAAVISLTHAAVTHLRKVYPSALRGQRVAVIPTCVDLDRFTPSSDPPPKRVIGCIGTLLSGWFRMDWLAAFFDAAARHDPALTFEVTTRDDREQVLQAFAQSAAVIDRLRISAAPQSRVPDIIRGQVASVMFFTDGLSKLGSSPTRMGEVLGSGVPVVTNAGVGDVADIIRSHRVGVLVAGSSPGEMEAAYEELQSLLGDPGLPDRCRAAAEKVFSLEAGIEAYRELYSSILEADPSYPASGGVSLALGSLDDSARPCAD